FHPPATTDIYPLSLHDALPISQQALYLLAFDPVVETTADHNSYGFRQQRSCADAIEQCFKTLVKPHPQWILEGDVKSCFDRISQDRKSTRLNSSHVAISYAVFC